MSKRLVTLMLAFTMAASAAQAQQQQQQPAPVQLEDVRVIAITPVPGVSLRQEQLSSASYVIDGEMLETYRDFDLASSLQKLIPSVVTVDAQNSPHQRDLHYRGYTASPLLGLPQGIAVYQNGVRINEPFGDVVQWDGLPEFAVNQAQMISGANPVFGLNALGGALVLQMKNGFDHDTINLEVGGGMFGRAEGIIEGGWHDKNWALYSGIKTAYDEGYRNESESNYHQMFTDVRYRDKDMEAAFDITLGMSDLKGNGPAPLDLIATEGRKAVFTYPDITENQLIAFNHTLSYELSDKLSMQANGYWRWRKRDTINGDEAETEECDVSGNEYLSGEEGTDCDDERYKDTAGAFIEVDDFLEAINTAYGLTGDAAKDDIDDEVGGAYNRSTTTSQSGGFTLQASYEDRFRSSWLDFDNLLTGGLSFDSGRATYTSSTELGVLTSDRGVYLSGIVLGTDSEEGAPVGLKTENTHLGLYLMNVMSPSDELDVTLAGRWNWSRIKMTDQLYASTSTEPNLDGNHTFNRFNPSVGVVWRPMDLLQMYGNYSESSRAPTAAELGCADPDEPCRLPNAFLADPPLEQVKNRSFEFGLRGNTRTSKDFAWEWSAAYFHGTNRDDILFIASGSVPGSGYFANVGKTERQGGEFLWAGRYHDFTWRLHYSFLNATFKDNFSVASETHPNAVNSAIAVQSGDRIPGIPRHSGAFFVAYDIMPEFNVGFDVIVRGDQYYRGDESNELDAIDGYVTVSLHSRYQFHENMQAFLRMDNLFNQKYETFGLLGEEPEEVLGYGENPRFVSVGLPFGVYGGLRVTY